jgi:nucleolar MIF4G domain-containing protein 1
MNSDDDDIHRGNEEGQQETRQNLEEDYENEEDYSEDEDKQREDDVPFEGDSDRETNANTPNGNEDEEAEAEDHKRPTSGDSPSSEASSDKLSVGGMCGRYNTIKSPFYLPNLKGGYVPPALRNQTEGERLKRQLRGLLNKLAQANLQPIATQLIAMYNTHSFNGELTCPTSMFVLLIAI